MLGGGEGDAHPLGPPSPARFTPWALFLMPSVVGQGWGWRWGMNSRFSSGWQIPVGGSVGSPPGGLSHLGVGRDGANQELWEALEFRRATMVEGDHLPLGPRGVASPVPFASWL